MIFLKACFEEKLNTNKYVPVCKIANALELQLPTIFIIINLFIIF